MIDFTVQRHYARLRDGLAISDLVMNHAILIHEKVMQSQFNRRIIDVFVLASACIYLSCRYHETPRTLKDVSFIGGTDRKDIARCYSWLIKNHREIGFVKPPKTNPRSLIGTNIARQKHRTVIYDCQYCGYKTEYVEVIHVHQYLRRKYGFCKERSI